jgi:polyhydroxybutyrate depolymerase
MVDRRVSALIAALCCVACAEKTARSSGSSASAEHRSSSAADGAPVASARAASGCSKPKGEVGERQLTFKSRTGRYFVSVPKAYEAGKRYPLGFAFHGRNRNHLQCRDFDCSGVQRVMGEEAVLVYMQSLREPLDAEQSGWESPSEREDNARFFELVLEQTKAELCIDERRVFVMGTSSGASFSNLLACRYGDRLLAVAPVAGGLPESQGCKGSPAAIVIHGIDDPQVPLAAGERARESFLERAGCQRATKPLIVDLHREVRRKRDAKPSIEAAECADYLGCPAASPLRWCEHSYGGYDGSTHGWPEVAGQLIWDFVRALP